MNVFGLLSTEEIGILNMVKMASAAENTTYLMQNKSNVYSKKAYDECAESLAFMPYLEGCIVSFRVGMTKLDPRMYQQFLDRYHLKAEDCVFIDDTEENVTAAEQIGFAGIVFHSYDDLLAQFSKLGVEIKS